MRKTPLSKAEKEEIERLLAKLHLLPPVAGQVQFHLDSNGKVASVEMARVVWR